jgi:hypothetical protein
MNRFDRGCAFVVLVLLGAIFVNEPEKRVMAFVAACGWIQALRFGGRAGREREDT